ncbi:MerR family DNA-binding protein [Actinosynnema sp. CA-299493]
MLRVVKAAQRLGFTLDEVADLLEAGRHRHGNRAPAGLTERVTTKLADVEARITDLGVIRDTLRTALAALTFPQVRVVAVAECGTHAIVAATLGPRRGPGQPRRPPSLPNTQCRTSRSTVSRSNRTSALTTWEVILARARKCRARRAHRCRRGRIVQPRLLRGLPAQRRHAVSGVPPPHPLQRQPH